MPPPSSVSKTTDYRETAVCLLCYPSEGNDTSRPRTLASLMAGLKYLCLSTIQHRILGLSCLIAFLRLSSAQGLPQLGLPLSGLLLFLNKNINEGEGVPCLYSTERNREVCTPLNPRQTVAINR